MRPALTLEDRARLFGEVTAADGSVWVRCMPVERIAETFPDYVAVEQQLHQVPVLGVTDDERGSS